MQCENTVIKSAVYVKTRLSKHCICKCSCVKAKLLAVLYCVNTVCVHAVFSTRLCEHCNSCIYKSCVSIHFTEYSYCTLNHHILNTVIYYEPGANLVT